MSHDKVDKLTYMANQIGRFFASQGPDRAVPGIADHLQKFWDPGMRASILAHLDAGGEGLDPLVRKALEKLRPKAEAKPEAALDEAGGERKPPSP